MILCTAEEDTFQNLQVKPSGNLSSSSSAPHTVLLDIQNCIQTDYDIICDLKSGVETLLTLNSLKVKKIVKNICKLVNLSW